MILLAMFLLWPWPPHEHGTVKLGGDGIAYVQLKHHYKHGPSCVASGAQLKLIRNGKNYRFHLYGGKPGATVAWDCKDAK